MEELYTKLFVKSEESHRDLLAFVEVACNGKLESPWTVVSGEYEVDVRPNENANIPPFSRNPHDFIYFPFTVEIVSQEPSTGTAEYVSFVASLMKKLYAKGMQVVAACDWEQDLPGGGRLGISNE